MSHFISVYENAVSEEFCDALIDRHLQLQEKSIEAPSRGQDANSQRKDIAFYLDIEDPEMADSLISVIADYSNRYIDEHPSLAWMNLRIVDVKVQETRPKGGFHRFHAERGLNRHSLRELVYTVYLNDVVEGEGETEYLEQGLKVRPKKGTVVIFPSAWTHTHRGTPVYSQNKYIATGWLVCDDA